MVKRLKVETKLYVPGKEVPGLGQVDNNHCGMPYLAGLNGLYYGVSQVIGHDEEGNPIFVDMNSGNRLDEDEVCNRLNNYKFDYLGIAKND